jgi:signal transduction histidine kinase
MMALFAVIVAVLLGASDLAFYLLVRPAVRAQLDRELVVAAAPLARELTSEVRSRAVSELDARGEYVELLDARGRTLQRSRNLPGAALGLPSGPRPLTRPAFHNLLDPSLGQLRVALLPLQARSGPVVLAVAMPTSDSRAILRKLRALGLALWCLSLLVTLGVSALYVGRSLAPIRELTRHASDTSARVGRVDLRALWTPLAVRDPDSELGRLAETFNHLFVRVDQVLRQLRQFVSDASHELRTPLSVLKGETELLLAAPRGAAEYQRSLRVMDGQLNKLNRIVEGLFTLSMADAGELRLIRGPLYLNEVLEDACALFAARAAARGIAIRRDLKRELSFFGDEAFLHQLFVIFLDNAIKYSPPDSEIAVSFTVEGSLVRVHIRDQGFGIAREHLEHIFNRFYRVARPGCNDTGSGGLGLAIAQAIARAHDGGTIECASEEGVGSTFTVSLPVSPANRASEA